MGGGPRHVTSRSAEAQRPKTCIDCLRSVPSTHRQRCPNCYRIWQRDNAPPNATCEVCARAYFRRPGSRQGGRTCGRACFAMWKRGRNAANEPTTGGQLVPCTCRWCGKPFETPQRLVARGGGLYCSLVCNGIRRRLNPERALYPENAWRQREGFSETRTAMPHRPDAQCARCGERRTKGNLVVHHPRPPEGDRELLLAPWNLEVLCRRCHFYVHHGSNAEVR